MRTSNKILAGTFLFILFVLTAIHAGLYARYKTKNFVTLNSIHEERYDRFNLKDVQSVSITGLDNVTIFTSDTARIEIEKGTNHLVHYELTDGVLTVKGDTIISRPDNTTERVKSNHDVIIYLPLIQHIKADFCELSLKGTRDTTKQLSLQLDLNETALHVGDWERRDTLSSLFNKIVITKISDGSVDFNGNVSIKELELNLQSADFNDEGLSADSLFINADKNSSVKLSGRNIVNTKLNTRP